MNKVKVLIVEDEFIIAENIREAVEHAGYECCGVALGFEEGKSLLKQTEPDIVLLDINLNDQQDGIDLAEIVNRDHQLPFIFISSYSDKTTLERAKVTKPHGYLLKPFEQEDIFIAIEIALNNFSQHTHSGTPDDRKSENLLIRNALFVKVKNMYHKVPYADILWLQSDGNYLKVFTKIDKYVIRESLGAMSAGLSKSFFRVHKSYAVNLDHVKAINSSYVVVDGNEIPIGRAYREELLKGINTCQ